MEMKMWWKRHNIDLGGKTTDEVEDFTGCIPLLLDSCVVDGKINMHVDAMQSIDTEVSLFISKIKDRSELDWSKYITLLKF